MCKKARKTDGEKQRGSILQFAVINDLSEKSLTYMQVSKLYDLTFHSCGKKKYLILFTHNLPYYRRIDIQVLEESLHLICASLKHTNGPFSVFCPDPHMVSDLSSTEKDAENNVNSSKTHLHRVKCTVSQLYLYKLLTRRPTAVMF